MSKPAIRFVSIAGHGLGPAADLLTAGYAGYFVPVVITIESLRESARCDGVDHALSCVATLEGVPLGAALVARRGAATRVAGLAVVRSARRQGVARAIMNRLIAEAKARGDREMELEVIEQNAAAVTLYEELGFQRVRRLVGYEGRANAHASSASQLEEIDPAEIARLVDLHGVADLPWQLSGATLLQLGPPYVGLRCGPSCVLISDPTAAVINVRALVTPRDVQRRGHATTLLHALFARHPTKPWRVSAIWPEEIGGVFTRAGLAPSALRQWQMRKSLG